MNPAAVAPTTLVATGFDSSYAGLLRSLNRRWFGQNHVHVMHRAAQCFWQFADEPLFHGTILVSMSGKGGYKPDGGKTVLRQASTVVVISKAIGFRRITVEIQDYGRVGHGLGADDVQIDRVALPPLNLQQLARESRKVIFFTEQWPLWS